MVLRKWVHILICAFLTAGAEFAGAVSFTSTDEAFTLDMPAGWKEVSSLPAKGVLSVQKENARIDIKTISCTTETCIEQKINNDLIEVKRKNMQVVGNSYTGEEIKRIEFSTGEPFFYISFFSPQNDFGAGYFLINSKAYSVLARNLTYAETDLIFSFISPRVSTTTTEAPSVEMDLQDPRAYTIHSESTIEEETVAAPVVTTPTEKDVQKTSLRSKLSFLKKRLARINFHTLSPHMPPYIRQLGYGFDVLILLIFLFVSLQVIGCVFRWFVPAKVPSPNANPNSLYPIQFTRLYGTPSLIFRAKDNQGNILISLSSRWDSLFLLLGLSVMVGTLLLLAVTGFCENNHLLPLSSFTYNTIYAACSLLIPLGLVVFACGFVWGQLVLREISLFNRKGNKVAIVLQKGFGLTQERYEIYFARSKDVVVATRRRFSWLRSWHMYTRDGQLLAQITETSAWRAALRKLGGHLWGFLRADYVITGQMDCTGSLTNFHAAFDKFTCQIDKPQALNARDLLVISLLINIRDRDKWYPWFN